MSGELNGAGAFALNRGLVSTQAADWDGGEGSELCNSCAAWSKQFPKLLRKKLQP